MYIPINLIVQLLVTFCIFPNLCHCMIHLYPKIHKYSIEGDDPGLPLLLTPYIEAGKIKEAQDASSVKPPIKSNITSYAGFFTVDKRFNSNMFFWFFPALQDPENAPVILWLQGGPGATSLYGLFNENGPFSVKRKHGLKLRKYAWTNSHSVIYIDNPVGTGFSFTNNDSGYSTNEIQVGSNLYSALIQFFTMLPQYQKNDFFVAGESYGGKYVPAITYTIHTKNPSAKTKINLKGMAIGNGLCDPEHMLMYGDYLYQIGLLDSNGRDIFQRKEKEVLTSIQQKKWKDAFLGFDVLLNGDMSNSSIFKNLTGFSLYFNYLFSKDYNPYGDMGRYLSYAGVRRNIHVGNATFHEEAPEVEKHLLEDVMQSVKPWVETLLEKYRVLIYNGQLDIIVAYPLTEGFLDALNWSGANQYKTAPRKQWYVENELAGYSKVAKGLTVVLVRNAGHMVPMDQAKWSVDLISRFTRNKPF